MKTHRDQIEDIIGKDATLTHLNDWDEFDKHPNIGEFRIYFEGGTSDQRSAEIINDPTQARNRVLSF